MTELNRRAEDVKIVQLESMTQTHHRKLNEIERTLGRTPDPKALRHMEHVIEELPHTDDLKECVKARSERSAMFKRVAWGVMGTVFGTIALATMALVWQGIALAMQGGAK